MALPSLHTLIAKHDILSRFWPYRSGSNGEKIQRAKVFSKVGNLEMITYEFYRRVVCGEDRLIGVLPERRKDPERITHNSIMNWGKLLAPEDYFNSKIYFVRVESR